MNAQDRIAAVTDIVMGKTANALGTMVNQIIENVRGDQKFLAAILTPGVDLNLDISVPPTLESKITILIAECVAEDRIELLETVRGQIVRDTDGTDHLLGVDEALNIVDAAIVQAKKELIDLGPAVVQAKAEPEATRDNGNRKAGTTGIVLPQGMVRCKCGRAVRTLTKCLGCGRDAGIAL